MSATAQHQGGGTTISTGRAVGLGVLSALLWSAAARYEALHLLVLIALVPWFFVLEYGRRNASVASGAVLGSLFYAISLYPLVSALDWTGWMVVSAEELAAIRRQQAFFLHALWFLLSLLGAVLWGLLGAAVRWAGHSGRAGALSAWRFSAMLVCVWIAVCEGLRLFLTWGFHWDFLGNALVANDVFRQASSLSGIRALTAIALAGNLLAYGGWRWLRNASSRWRPVTIAAGAVVVLALGYGGLRLVSAPSGEAIRVTALQHSKDTYTSRDFASIGIDRSFLLKLEREVPADRDLVVLPETISFGSLVLDDSAEGAFPGKPKAPVDSWTAVLSRVLRGRDSVVAIGVETIRDGQQYNSMGLWDREQVLDWYDKRRLVPFAEYFPRILGRFSARGESRFTAGTEAAIWSVPPMRIGVFICQEVLFPAMTRDSVLNGANVLISGGNDGVFSNPRVATAQARLARLRATETGRAIVRAMKTGRSAIIDRRGREIAASENAEPIILNREVYLSEERTLFVRFGDWLLWLASLGAVCLLVSTARLGPASP